VAARPRARAAGVDFLLPSDKVGHREGARSNVLVEAERAAAVGIAAHRRGATAGVRLAPGGSTMRRNHGLALLALPLGIAPLLAHGCSTESAFESVCDWVADPDNCYRELRAGMLDDDAGPSALEPGCTFPGAQPTQVDDAKHAPAGVSNGAFQTIPPMLATCIVDSGGSVTFAPPINLAAYPPSLESTPITYTITLADAFGVTCGTATYTSPHGFSISIAAPSGTGGGGGGGFTLMDAGERGAGGGFEPTDFGTYTQTIAPGRDAFDVTCPSGETHVFNLDESGDAVRSAGPDTSECPGYASLVPSASLQIDPGGAGRAGAVSFAIVYPDTSAPYPPFQSVGSADGFNPDAKNVPPPVTVVYFNCAIPAAPPLCMDGMKDGTETDVDCGGPAVDGCPARCAGGLGCDCDGDCASDLCFVDPMTGMRACYDPTSPPTTSDGGALDVGHGVGACGYLSICDGSICSGAASTCCGGRCVDTASDTNNCGGCGQACCGATPICRSGACTSSSDAGAPCPDAG
jgi:hypothetical protein